MAQYFELEKNSVGLAWIWNVTSSVSPYAYSRRADVMLVQHALNTVMAQLQLKDDKGELIYYLHRDGYMGPKTKTAIASFQRSLKASGRYVVADGVVDPSSRSGWTNGDGGQFTIVYLNREHRLIHGAMMEEKDFPELLQTELRVNKNLK